MLNILPHNCSETGSVPILRAQMYSCVLGHAEWNISTKWLNLKYQPTVVVLVVEVCPHNVPEAVLSGLLASLSYLPKGLLAAIVKRNVHFKHFKITLQIHAPTSVNAKPWQTVHLWTQGADKHNPALIPISLETCDLAKVYSGLSTDRITEWFGLDGTQKVIQLQPPCHGQGHLPIDQAAQNPCLLMKHFGLTQRNCKHGSRGKLAVFWSFVSF